MANKVTLSEVVIVNSSGTPLAGITSGGTVYAKNFVNTPTATGAVTSVDGLVGAVVVAGDNITATVNASTGTVVVSGLYAGDNVTATVGAGTIKGIYAAGAGIGISGGTISNTGVTSIDTLTGRVSVVGDNITATVSVGTGTLTVKGVYVGDNITATVGGGTIKAIYKAGNDIASLAGGTISCLGYWENLYSGSKPFVTVSPTGTINGGTVVNNGCDYGPDTSGTKTSGIQEAVTSIFNAGGGKIFLLAGTFIPDATFVGTILGTVNGHVIDVPLNGTINPIITIEIEGVSAGMADYQVGYTAGGQLITPPSPMNGSIIYTNVVPASVAGGNAIFGAAPTSSGGFANNVNIILKNLTIRTKVSATQPTAWQFDNFAGYDIENLVADVDTDNFSAPTSGIGISINRTVASNGFCIMRSAYVVGYYMGIYLAPQHDLFEYCFVQYCAYGINMEWENNGSSYGLSAFQIDIEQCITAISFNAPTVDEPPIRIYNLQLQTQGSSATFPNTNKFFAGLNNHVFGEINYYVSGANWAVNKLTDGTTSTNVIFNQILGGGSSASQPSPGASIANIVGIDDRIGLTAADAAPITIYTIGAADELLEFHISARVTAYTSGTMVYTLSPTEASTGSAYTTILSITDTVVHTLFRVLRCKAATAITVQLTGTFVGKIDVFTTVTRIQNN